MLHSEFYHLFRPPLTDATPKKRNEKSGKSAKAKASRKHYSMSREMRGIASGFIREMLEQSGSHSTPDAFSLMAGQSTRLESSPYVELNCNASQFCVFAAIRQCVLDKQLKSSALVFNSTFARMFNELNDSDDDDSDTKTKESVIKVPKVVGIGICVAFELIRESRYSHPLLCIRALNALLNALQGLMPEGLKNEPSDVINPLFELLLEIASSPTYQKISDIEASSSSTSTVVTSSSLKELKSHACSALLSLVTARGDTGKTLSAVTALLTAPHNGSDSEIETPNILITLQRSVHSILLGKTKRPDWVTHGFPLNSLCDSFSVQISAEIYSHSKQSSLAFDGKYLYLYSGNVIYKIGSGYCGTIKGQVLHSHSIGSHKTQSGQIGWIGCVGDFLYLQTNNWTRNELIQLEKHGMKEIGKVSLGVSHWGPSACASDNDSLILITSTKDDCFVIRTIKPSSSMTINALNASDSSTSAYLMPVTQELTIKLSHKRLNFCGGIGCAIFEQSMPAGDQMKQQLLRPIDTLEADDIIQISAGKDFAVIRTHSGKILFTGKAQSLGVKQNGGTIGKWCELPITKSPKIEHIAVGHEGAHALLVADDGSVFFVGLAKRGEDGEQSKGRRQPKAGKPKKMIKMEGKRVEFAACNHGSSVVITKSGELFIFGKDAHHVDRNTGQVLSLKNIFITQVAIGKAHILALSNNGQVYTFGISNKGQCGLDLLQATSAKELGPNHEYSDESNVEQQIDMSEDLTEPLCTLGHHRWKYDQCMICTICGECTGYGSSCIASGKSERNPGMSCGCGAGDAGCADCGCCRACETIPKESFTNAEENDGSMLPLNRMAFNVASQLNFCDPLSSDMQRFASAFSVVDGGMMAPSAIASNDLREHEYEELPVRSLNRGDPSISRINPRVERRRIGIDVLGRRLRHASKAYRNLVSGRANSIESGDDIGAQHLDIIDKAVSNVINIDLDQGSDGETSKLTPLPPTKLNISNRIIQIACGLHHSVLLTSSGDVLTFGSNQHGQLGHGDFAIREVPTKVLINATIVQIAAGSNHTVLLSNQGQVFTFGNNQKGQLGRAPSAIDYSWNAIPGVISNIGQQFGRKATWISASGDHTFIKFDESFINPLSLSSSRVIANRRCIAIIAPNSDTSSNVSDSRYDTNDRTFHSLIISRADGICKSFNASDQIDLSKFSAVCLDNFYDLLWTYTSETHTIGRYNIIASEAKIPNQLVSLPSILLPELAIPQKPLTHVNRTTAALNLLCTLDTLTSAQQLGLTIQDDEQSKGQIVKNYSKDDYSSVCRFESHGGGWGFSSHSIEAIRFMADTDIILGGFGLFGGRGEYTAKLKLFDIGPDGGEQEGDGELLAETEETPFECAARQKYPILFDEPIPLQANRWYVSWARISGPSSDCGSSGQSVVNTEDQVIFYFKSSKKSNNGTDVNAGQIPQLLYKVYSVGNDMTNHVLSRNDYNSAVEEPICIIGREFSLTVTADCFQSLLKLLRWSWNTFKLNMFNLNSYTSENNSALSSTLIELKHLSLVCCASLHLLKIYTNELFPNRYEQKIQTTNDSMILAECIYDVRTLLKLILSDPPESAPRNHSYSNEVNALICQIMDECQESFLACYHAFYPTNGLRWRGLCDLLLSKDQLSPSVHLLSAMLASLCRPWVKLIHTFPMMHGLDIYNIQSPSDLQSPNSDLGNFQHSILSEKISEKTDKEGCHSGSECSARDIINNLLKIIGQPIEYALQHETNADYAEYDSCLSQDETGKGYTTQLVENACNLISTILSELVAQVTGIGCDSQVMSGQQLHITPSRFSRISQNRTWNTGNGSPDAICFSVDRPGISIAGVTVYGGIGNEWHYELELLDYHGVQADERSVTRDGSQSHPWRTIDMVRGSYVFEDKTIDVCEIKFERALPILPNVKYAIRLKNHGPRTNNGDGGLTHIRGPDNTTFTFSDCSLSFNGTNHARGQIPQILYYSAPQSFNSEFKNYPMNEEIPRKNAIAISDSVISLAIDLLSQAQECASSKLISDISSSLLIKKLLPLILAYLSPIATSDCKSSLQILSLIRQLLPLVVNLNKFNDFANSNRSLSPQPTSLTAITTSRHYVIVESDHPYKPANVYNYRVNFPPSIKWMSVEFDSRCATAQPEDSLQLSVPSISTSNTWNSNKNAKNNDKCSTLWPILRKFKGRSSSWPTNSIVIPGSELMFSLETASDYVKEEKSSYYGFRCQVVGYENAILDGLHLGLQYLEQELTYLSGVCIGTLLKKNINLPAITGDREENLEISLRTFELHSTLLSKGLSLSHPIVASEAIDGIVPLANEHSFLKDFCSLTPGTSGARLAKWFQCESFVDPNQCEVHCSGVADQELQCGWPTVITVITRDQYANMVNVPNLKVEVSAQPFHSNANTQSNQTNSQTIGDMAVMPPNQNVAYSITAKDKMFYHAITMMRQYENYSFEELRFVSPIKRRTMETMLVRSNNDGTYTANWTPGSTGWYQLKITVDGDSVNASQSVLVGEPTKGVALPLAQPLSTKSSKKAFPLRTRKFVGRNSSGLRIRSLPSLQSEQIGIIEVNGIISIVEELHNDDGVWVRLTPESIAKHCNTSSPQQQVEAWCLQYNQHIGKTLLVPFGEPKSILTTNAPTSSTVGERKYCDVASVRRKKYSEFNRRLDFPALFHVVKCGVSGHNIRCKPHLRSPPVGMLVLGNVVAVVADVTNSSGTWVKLDEESMKRYCFNTDGEGWSLSRTINDVIYLQHEAEVMHITDEEDNDSRYQNSNIKTFSRHNGLPAVSFTTSHEDKSLSSPSNACGSSVIVDKSMASNKTPMSLTSISVSSESEVESIPNDSFIGGNSLLACNSFTGLDKSDIESSAYCDSSANNSTSSVMTAGSRVAALQKKLLHESESKVYCKNANRSSSSSPAREPPPELQGINVKELVKAIGRDQSPTPPSTPPMKRTPVTSRSSSPSVSIGSARRSLQSTVVTIPIKLTSYSPTVIELNSNNLKTNQTQNNELVDDSFKDIPPKCFIQKATQTSPPEKAAPMSSHYLQFKLTNDIHSAPSKSSHSSPVASPKQNRIAKECSRNSRQTRTKRERANSSTSNLGLNAPNVCSLRASNASVKEAISNSVAECIRAVFAAFIWHEGILHDTLAAASYLKFNPEVTKDTVKVFEQECHCEKVKLRPTKKFGCKGSTKEEKAKYRHSVEVSQLSDFQQESYLNANVDQNKIISETDLLQTDSTNIGDANSEQAMSQSEESANDKVMIPETLVNLLKLWEVVSKCVSNSIVEPPASVITPANLTPPATPVQMFNKIQNNPRVIQTNSEDFFVDHARAKAKQLNEMPLALLPNDNMFNNRFSNQFSQHGNLFGEAAMANGGSNFEARESAHSSLCELCGNSYSYPVTHHMRKMHAGCGEHAGGKGYNSSGSFCGGWAGHCGDGGIGSSNWYLICDKCREKYLTQKRHNNKAHNSKSKHSTVNELKSLAFKSPLKANISSPATPAEVHQLIKDNAMFLLRMSPASDTSGILSTFNSTKAKHTQEFVVHCSSFQCLENLGIHHSAYHQRLAEEHLSEDEIRAIQNGRPSKLNSVEHQFEENESDSNSSLKTNEKNKSINIRSAFHRSVSVGLHERQQERVMLTQRKRAISNDNSSTTFLCQPSATLINLVQACCFDNQYNLEATTSQNSGVIHSALTSLLNRPIMQFILQQHDLDGLMIAMKNALRKASCRTLALYALNWLLRNVSQTVSLHDLMWCFVASLTSNESRVGDKEENEDNAANGAVIANVSNNALNNVIVNSVERRDDHELHYHSQNGICQHPLADLAIAGEAALPLMQAFHTFLQTVSDLMPLLPMGSPLQQIAVRCFCIQFDSADHSFLHQCHVFSNISKIFSRTEENSGYAEDVHQSIIHPIIETYQDLTLLMEIKASSRQAMIGSLTDNSTETFWESGDEDRNKTKVITINNNGGREISVKSVYIHVDNVRDLGSKVANVSFKCGDTGVLETQTSKLKTVEIENRFAGWIHCSLPSSDVSVKTIKLELKGPDNTLRLRQIKILGLNQARSQDNVKPVLNSIQIQQANCEAETLRVFRLLTSQVFGKLISGEADSDGGKAESISGGEQQNSDLGSSGAANDLREHMVGILFSRSGKLTHLQKQVCAHIVQAIRVEAIRLREEWETLLCSKSSSIAVSGEIPSDAYCFEMLSMVLALSGSTVGRQYLALQNDLLLDLFSLLHTGSARVQRQVTSLLRRVLPEIKPTVFASMFGISSLPPRDIIVSNEKLELDIHNVGILDVFLACIAKSITVQTKVKGGSSNKTVTTVTLATAIHTRDHLGGRWWLRGCLSRKLAECIISLLKDMAAGKLSDTWASVTKNAIAQNILNLTRMSDKYRVPTECVKTPTLWIALASLCVLEQEHAERLSSSHWVNAGDQANGNQQSRPLCDNHDDGETPAIILCNVCGNLCAECDRFLHLHSKTRTHQRQVFKEEEEAIKVDLHEGCGRTKLFWVMALADSKTLKAMVEFRGENTRSKSVAAISGQKSLTSNATGICRFCGATGNIGLLAIGNVCSEPECQEYARSACNKVLSCGHQCGGVANEERCLPCLHGCSGELKQDGDDMCMICFIEALSCAPVIQLKCGHLFHQHCCKAVLKNRWPGPRITFSFSFCPICKCAIEHNALQELLIPINNLYEDVHRKALMRLEYEGLHRCEAIVVSGGRFFNDPAGYAMERYAYYVCCKCKKAYYGGEARCDAEAGIGDNYDPSELVCGGCSDVSRAQMCPKHGTDFLEYKCRYCCSVAVFFCFGTTHFCNACHDDFQKLTNLREFPKCPAGPRGKQLEGDECPLHVKHPPTGEEFALGCGVCRNAHTF